MLTYQSREWRTEPNFLRNFEAWVNNQCSRPFFQGGRRHRSLTLMDLHLALARAQIPSRLWQIIFGPSASTVWPRVQGVSLQGKKWFKNCSTLNLCLKSATLKEWVPVSVDSLQDEKWQFGDEVSEIQHNRRVRVWTCPIHVAGNESRSAAELQLRF